METFNKEGMNQDYVRSYIVNNIEFEVFIDDYGQTYYIQYLKDGKMFEEVCGAYMTDIEGYLEYRSENMK